MEDAPAERSLQRDAGSSGRTAQCRRVRAFDLLRERARRIVEADRKLLRDFLEQQSSLSAVSTEWGTTSFPRLSMETRRFSERLRSEFDTSAVPGRFFEMPDHFRIGMGVNMEMFAEGLNRIGRALR